MKKVLITLSSLAMALAMLAGCSSAPAESTAASEAGASSMAASTSMAEGDAAADGETIKVGFAIKTLDSPYFISLVDATKMHCEELGWEFTSLDAGGDTLKEAENMETFMTQGMDLIFLDSVDPSACVPSINAAAELGIPVINLDSGVDECEQATTVYSDNLQNGRNVGLAYVDYLEADGRGEEEIISIVLSGMKGNVAGLERRSGLFAGIIEGRTGVTEEEAWTAAEAMEQQLIDTGSATNEDANFTIRGQGWGAWTREEGLVAAEDFITANPDLNLIMGENDQMLFGGMEALDNAGITGVDILAAADGAKEAYDLIRLGTEEPNPYIATGENSPFKVAELGVQIAAEILVDGADWTAYPDVTLTDAVAVTAENVDERYEFGF